MNFDDVIVRRAETYKWIHRLATVEQWSAFGTKVVPIAVIIAIVLLGTLPFLNRPVSLDEHLLLQLARSARENGWWFHEDIPTVFFGIPLQNLSTHTHPPVAEYCLALVYKLAGDCFDEVRFRAVFLIFPIAAALAFYHLASRFTDNPTAVATLFAASPAFFVLSPTLMADIPALTFLLIGLACYFRQRLWPAALVLALAVGTTYMMLIPVGCLLIWMVFDRRRLSEIAIVAAAIVPLVLWLVITSIHFRQIPTVETARYMWGHRSVLHNAAAILSFVGGTCVLPWGFLFLQWMRKWKLIVVLSFAVAILSGLVQTFSSRSYSAAYLAIAASGAALLIVCGFRLWDGRASHSYSAFFGMWIVAGVSFLLFLPEMIAARYLLILMPPLFMICFRKVRRFPAIVVTTATLALSFTLAVADFRLANSYRDWVNRYVPELQNSGFTLWSGAESGLRFYLQRRGIRTLSFVDLTPAAGDLIIRQDLFSYGLSSNLEPELIAIHSDVLSDRFPVRTLSKSAHAGFHDSRAGLLPYVFSRASLDMISIDQVSPLVTSLPQSVPSDFSSVPVWSAKGVLLKQVAEEMAFHPNIPKGSVVQYDLQGEGDILVEENTIRLFKRQRDPVLWLNLRIVPAQFGKSPSR